MRHTMTKIDHPIRALKEAVGWYFRGYPRKVTLLTKMLDYPFDPFEELTVPANERGFHQKYVVYNTDTNVSYRLPS